MDAKTQYSNLVFPWLLSQSSKHTRRAYERIINSFIGSISDFSLEKVTPSEVAQFLSEVRASGRQSKYNQARSALSSFFNFQIRAGLLPSNPTLAFKTKAVPLPTLRFLPDEEIYFRVVGAESVLRNQIMLHAAFILGLRISEILSICFCHFKYGLAEEVYLSVHGKGGRVREVLVPEWLWLLIQRYMIEENIAAKELLFHSVQCKSKALSQFQAYRIFICAGKRVGLKMNLNPHKYRHGHATTALLRGASIKALKDEMGHSSLLTLQRYVEQAKLQDPSTLFKQPPLLLEGGNKQIQVCLSIYSERLNEAE